MLRRHVIYMTGSVAKPFARATRPVPTLLINVAKGASNAMAEEWAQKARRYVQLSELQIRPNPSRTSDTSVAVQTEGQKVLKTLTPHVWSFASSLHSWRLLAICTGDADCLQDYMICMDERGKAVTSEAFAEIIAQVHCSLMQI